MNSLVLTSSGLSDVGPVRAANQDSFLCDDILCLYVVADGMGGHKGGEVASQLCIDVIHRFLRPYQESTSANWSFLLKEAVLEACQTVYDRALEEPSLTGMGTTVTLVKINGEEAHIAHVGDSRLHLVRAGFLYQITKDHSLVQEQIEAGLITEEEAKTHHLRHVVSRCVGYQSQELVDTQTIRLFSGDRLFLTSDGLHQYVEDEFVIAKLRDDIENANQQLILQATQHGSDDNMTGVVVAVNGENERRGDF